MSPAVHRTWITRLSCHCKSVGEMIEAWRTYILEGAVSFVRRRTARMEGVDPDSKLRR
jgi:hypothetical protein